VITATTGAAMKTGMTKAAAVKAIVVMETVKGNKSIKFNY